MKSEFLKMVGQTNSVIAIDFDGVIHDDDKGFHDGTIYGNLIPGTVDALKSLSKNYKLILYTCKANPSRPLIDNKTGIELIWQWLKQNKLDEFISDITFGKPNAFIYIDDKGYKFNNWNQTLTDLSKYEN